MLRVSLASVIGFIAVTAASAGPISVQIGGASGLSAGYINQTNGVCAAGAGNCVAGSTTGWAESNYNSVLFAGATNASGSPVPFTGYTQTGGEASGLTMSNTSGTQFAMVADGVNNPTKNQSNNYWQSINTGGASNPDTITIPIGVYGVTDTWMMLQNVWGSQGGNDTTVTFNFGTTSNATTGLTSIPVALLNSDNAGHGEVRSAISCTGGSSLCSTDGFNPQGVLASATINGVTVNETTAFANFPYTSIPSTYAYYTGGTGKLKLDSQQFVFDPSVVSSLWLVSVSVTENIPNTFASNSSLPSETAISAITVDAVTPEPSTILLGLAGLGVLGFSRLRKKNA